MISCGERLRRRLPGGTHGSRSTTRRRAPTTATSTSPTSATSSINDIDSDGNTSPRSTSPSTFITRWPSIRATANVYVAGQFGTLADVHERDGDATSPTISARRISSREHLAVDSTGRSTTSLTGRDRSTTPPGPNTGNSGPARRSPPASTRPTTTSTSARRSRHRVRPGRQPGRGRSGRGDSQRGRRRRGRGVSWPSTTAAAKPPCSLPGHAAGQRLRQPAGDRQRP